MPHPPAWPGALTAAESRLQGPGLAVDHVVHRGEPAIAIADEAAAFGADLAIIGSRGLGPVETVGAGSVAAAIAEQHPAPRGGPRGARPARGARPQTHRVPAMRRCSDHALDEFGGVPIAVLAVNADAPGYGQPSDMILGRDGPPGGSQDRRYGSDAAHRRRPTGQRARPDGRCRRPDRRLRGRPCRGPHRRGYPSSDGDLTGNPGQRRPLRAHVRPEASVLVVKTRIEGDAPPSADD